MSDSKKPISKASPPIKPLTGSGYVPIKKAETRAPDWPFWLKRKAICVWEACALSLGINPESMELDRDVNLAGPADAPCFTPESFPSEKIKWTFEKRLQLASDYIFDSEHFELHELVEGNPAECKIYLPHFSAWAISVANWDDMPSELVALAAEPTSRTMKPEGLRGEFSEVFFTP